MKQETLEEVALKLYQYQSENPPYTIITPKAKVEGFIEGAKWNQERMYSEAIGLFITEIKNEFKDENWDYLEFIKLRLLEDLKKK
jgi:hypothetical protein